jgi:predicted enzyme related to lactoylglutathione lyase
MEQNTSGTGIIWSELMSRDPQSSARFYEEVARLRVVPAGEGAENYWVLLSGSQPVGGMTGNHPGTEVWPSGGPEGHWVGYFASDDVDSASDKAVALGGQKLVGPLDIPGVGRVAVMRDPDGATFGLFAPAS